MLMAQFSITKIGGNPSRYKVDVFLRDWQPMEIRNILTRKDANAMIKSHINRWLSEPEHLEPERETNGGKS